MMENIRLLIALLILARAASAGAQADSLWHVRPAIEVSGFLDVFYGYDFNHPASDQRQPFLYNHNRHNAFNLNLGLIRLAATHPKYRAAIALQAGTYPNDNYAAEPGSVRNIFEANAGLSLNRQNNLWLDAGIFASHIGFESAISMDNWTLTRSLAAENSPYYLAGAKLTFKPDETWELAALVLNGWQRIQRVPGNSLPSFGTQLRVNLGPEALLNWSTFVGTDDPDTMRRMRYFNNLYGQFQLTDKVGLILGMDIGVQQRAKGSPEHDLWYTPVIIGRASLGERWQMALRAEYYRDETGIIIPTGTANGFSTTGLSLNLDYAPVQAIQCRVEGRWLHSRDEIFESPNGPTDDNFCLMTSIAVRFAELVR